MDSLLLLPEAAETERVFGRTALKEELRRAIAQGATEPSDLVGRASARARAAVRADPPAGHQRHRRPAPHESRALAPVRLGPRSPVEDRGGLLHPRVRPGDRGGGDTARTTCGPRRATSSAPRTRSPSTTTRRPSSSASRRSRAGRRVLVSRGELVAIGGSFKIPEILESSGAVLAEVGTTNRTSIEDYRRALSPETALLLTVHPSNYEIRGYTRRPQPGEIAALAREAGIPWLHDHGTGCVAALDEFGVPGEATVASCLADGADVVTFSADKLFGGPQAGFIAGKAALVGRIAAHPVARVVRPDKLTLAALAATIAAWKTGKWRESPIYRAAAASLESLEARGGKIRDAAARPAGGPGIEVVGSTALFGGGTSPEKAFASRALAVSLASAGPEDLAARLREADPPIVARIEGDRVLLDLRSIDPTEDAAVAAALAVIVGGDAAPSESGTAK